jgi:hypothetical protein
MSHLTVKRKAKTFHVPLASVQNVIELMDANFSANRKALIQDLADMDASDETKIKAMDDLRQRKGMTTDLIRSAFTLAGARSILEHVVSPEDFDEVVDTTPDDLVQLALQVLGFDIDDDSKGDDAPADPTQGDGTSTKKP